MIGRVLGIGRDFPYRVLIRVPAGAGHPMLDQMHEFCRARDMTYRAHELPRKPGVHEYVVWCFANPIHAHVFRRHFGGERITITEEFRRERPDRG
jgi:hypothetical protein